MAESEVQNIAPAAVATAPQQAGNTYRMSKEGRWQAVILLLGVISIWVFALWSLITILDGGISGVEWVSALLMLGILAVAPLVAWALLEEANAQITTNDAGITYRSFGGVDIAYEWDDLAGFERKGQRGRIARFFLGDDDELEIKEEPVTRTETTAVAPNNDDNENDNTDENVSEDEPETVTVKLRNNHYGQIENPLVRFLHRQAHGGTLPIYGGLENRDQLLDEIATHSEL